MGDRAAPKSACNDDQLRAIGNVTVQFALLEHIIIDLVHELLTEQHRVKQVITSNLSCSRLLELLGHLAPLRAPNLEHEVQAVIKHAESAEKKRNGIVHSIWNAAPQRPGQVLRFKRNLRMKVPQGKNTLLRMHGWQVEEMDARKIEALAEFISEVRLEALTIWMKLVSGSSGNTLTSPERK